MALYRVLRNSGRKYVSTGDIVKLEGKKVNTYGVVRQLQVSPVLTRYHWSGDVVLPVHLLEEISDAEDHT
jgi:hypothetical protein